MRLLNPLNLKKAAKKAIGLDYIMRSISVLVVNKATQYQLRQIQSDILKLRKASTILANAPNKNLSDQIEKSLSDLYSDVYNPENNAIEKKFIFVCGLHRSGTTLLTKILQQHPDISGFENTGVIEDEGQFLQTVYLTSNELGWAGSFGYSADAHLTEESELVKPENRDKIYSQWSNYWDSNAKYLIEKSPPNLLKTRFLQALFQNSYFIIIRRHPVVTGLATKKWSSSSVYSLIKHWFHCYDLWDQDKKYINNYVEIKYEDLVSNTAPVLKSVFKFCGLDDRYIKNSLDKFNISTSVNEKYHKEWKDMKYAKFITENTLSSKFRKHGYDVKV